MYPQQYISKDQLLTNINICFLLLFNYYINVLVYL